MGMQKDDKGACSRRTILTGSVALLGGIALGGVAVAATAPAKDAKTAIEPPPPLPWKWTKLDPLEAGRRAYRAYFEKGGCGSGSYLGLLSLLKEKVGHPWTTLPDMAFAHAAAGYGGHGTLCGALGGASYIINLVAYKDKDEVFRQMIDRLFYWYAEQEFPTERFDDISSMPKQVKVKATAPLCHVSVSKWVNAVGENISSKAKKERCAKVTGEVVYIVTTALNEYFDGKWSPPVWKPSKEIEHCVQCHGPDDMQHVKASMNHQQGHMECLQCHTDHTKAK